MFLSAVRCQRSQNCVIFLHKPFLPSSDGNKHSLNKRKYLKYFISLAYKGVNSNGQADSSNPAHVIKKKNIPKNHCIFKISL